MIAQIIGLIAVIFAVLSFFRLWYDTNDTGNLISMSGFLIVAAICFKQVECVCRQIIPDTMVNARAWHRYSVWNDCLH